MMRQPVPVLMLACLIAFAACISSPGATSVDSASRVQFLSEAHERFEEAGFQVTDEALHQFLDDTCLVVRSGIATEFEDYIRGIQAGDPPAAFKDAAEFVARQARSEYC